MTRALAAGGLRLVYDEAHEARLQQKWAGQKYHPNPNGYFELTSRTVGRLDSLYDSPFWHVAKLAPVLFNRVRRSLTVIRMSRDPEEVRASQEETFGEVREYLFNPVDLAGHQVINVTYGDCIDHALETFLGLDLPIDPVKAAATVDTALYRHSSKKV